MLSVSTLRGPLGAPRWVNRYCVEKLFIQFSIATMDTMIVVGRNRGRMMWVTVCFVLAPSIVAASITDVGIFAIPVTTMMEKYPMYFQKYIIAVDTYSLVVLVSQLWSTPGVPRRKFTRLFANPLGSKRISQIKAATTLERIAGE